MKYITLNPKIITDMGIVREDIKEVKKSLTNQDRIISSQSVYKCREWFMLIQVRLIRQKKEKHSLKQREKSILKKAQS
jgi:hypothetical protein